MANFDSASNALQCLQSRLDHQDSQVWTYDLQFSAVKHMAASLAVEWAKNGIRVNALRCERCISTYCLSNCLSSPGYMLTKLTKTVLEHDQERKVLYTSFFPYVSFRSNLPFLSKRIWENLTPLGRVSRFI